MIIINNLIYLSAYLSVCASWARATGRKAGAFVCLAQMKLWFFGSAFHIEEQTEPEPCQNRPKSNEANQQPQQNKREEEDRLENREN